MFINQQDQLIKFAQHLQNQTLIAIDTEFHREKTYYPVLSLIQIATAERAVIIDVLSGLDLNIIAAVLTDEKVVKVFHASSQDIEVLYHHFKIVVKNIYDSQIAAQFIGHKLPPSYDKLVAEYTGIALSKKFQYSDWLKRPLTYSQLEYAINDVAYLLQIRDEQLKIIVKDDKLVWLSEEFNKLSQYHYQPTMPIDLLGKFINNFESIDSLSLVYVLLELREALAMDLNKHRNLILHDKSLIFAVKNNKIDKSILKKLGVNDIQEIFLKSRNLKTRAIIQQFINSIKKSSYDKEIFQKLKNLLEEKSLKTNIAPSLIANRNDLKLLTVKNFKCTKVLQGWRNEVYGRDAMVLLS